MSDHWQKHVDNAFKKLQKANKERRGTNLTANEVAALSITVIGEWMGDVNTKNKLRGQNE